MGGSRLGGLRAAKTILKRHGKNFYKDIGYVGGTQGTTGGFASKKVGKDGLTGSQRAKLAGAKGGTRSRRGKAVRRSNSGN